MKVRRQGTREIDFAMKVTHAFNTPVFDLSASKDLIPPGLSDRQRKKLARSSAFLNGVELIHDLQFPVSTGGLYFTADGETMLGFGDYPPQVHCYSLRDVSLKFSRHSETAILDMALLGHNYRKFVTLHDNRLLEFHAAGGLFHKLRLPVPGRKILFDPVDSNLFVAGASPCLLPFNLEAGAFGPPLRSFHDASAGAFDDSGILSVAYNAQMRILATGGVDGAFCLLDPRSPAVAAARSLDAPTVSPVDAGLAHLSLTTAAGDPAPVTALAFGANGLQLAVGSGVGVVYVFDLRMSAPLCVRDHYTESPIISVQYVPPPAGAATAAVGDFAAFGTAHSATSATNNGPIDAPAIVSADARGVRIWQCDPSMADGSGVRNLSAFDVKGGVSAVTVAPRAAPREFDSTYGAGGAADARGGSGVIMVAGGQPRVQAFYAPVLGPPPKWCEFLAQLCDDGPDDDADAEADGRARPGMLRKSGDSAWKFVNRDEYAARRLLQLIPEATGRAAADVIKPYMHGFLVDARALAQVAAAEVDAQRAGTLPKDHSDFVLKATGVAPGAAAPRGEAEDARTKRPARKLDAERIVAVHKPSKREAAAATSVGAAPGAAARPAKRPSGPSAEESAAAAADSRFSRRFGK